MENLNKKIKAAQTINEVLDVLNEYYDLDERLGLMNKGVVITGFQKAIKICGIKKRE